MSKGEQTRDRIIECAAALIEQQGALATGINQILNDSGAPRGSLYFHFPGGKEEIVSAGLELAAERWRKMLQEQMLGAVSPGQAVQRACRGLGARLKRSGYTLGCPITTTALEVGVDEDGIRQQCAHHFSAWEKFLAEQFSSRGIRKSEAKGWATLALVAVEGALVLSRTYRTTTPLRRAGDLLAQQLDAAVDKPGPPADD